MRLRPNIKAMLHGTGIILCAVMIAFIGFIFGLAAPNESSKPMQYEMGWILAQIGFISETGNVVMVSGACLVDEDFDQLMERHPSAKGSPEEILFPGEDENAPKVGL